LGRTPIATTASSQECSVSVLELDPRQFPIFAEKRGDAIIGDDVRSFTPHTVFHQLCDFPIEKSQQLQYF
jgi:hypothetical protein